MNCCPSCYFGLLSKLSETCAAVQPGVKLSAQQVRNVRHSLTDTVTAESPQLLSEGRP
jgi:hypothetical protein